MIENDWFENDIVRIGAEQEMVLVHKESYKPATVAMEALELMKDLPWVETELAKFNLEINLQPRTFEGDCFTQLHDETAIKLNKNPDCLGHYGCVFDSHWYLTNLEKVSLGHGKFDA